MIRSIVRNVSRVGPKATPFVLPKFMSTNGASFDPKTTSVNQYRGDRVYHWIDKEAEDIISRSYAAHDVPSPLPAFRGKVSNAELEKLSNENSFYEPQTFGDHMAWGIMRFLRIFTHMYFKNKHTSHAVVLETVAAIPGYIASSHMHLRSLRTLRDDYDWIRLTGEEAENERMHLLIWLTIQKPTLLERGLIAAVQFGYLTVYSFGYFFVPRFCHRITGYLEYEAVAAYTAFLKAIDAGEVPNGPAPPIARQYYGLDEEATIRDVVLRVRADECMHRDFNHHLSEKYHMNDSSEPSLPGGTDAKRRSSIFQKEQQ